jgi:hypothetical protein
VVILGIIVVVIGSAQDRGHKQPAGRNGFGTARSGTQGPPPTCLSHALAPDRQPLDLDRMRAFGLQGAPVDHHPGRAAPFADAERRDDDIGDAASSSSAAGWRISAMVLPITLPMQPMRRRNGLFAQPPQRRDPRHRRAASCHAVICPRGRQRKRAVPGAERHVPPIALDQNVGLFALTIRPVATMTRPSAASASARGTATGHQARSAAAPSPGSTAARRRRRARTPPIYRWRREVDAEPHDLQRPELQRERHDEQPNQR